MELAGLCCQPRVSKVLADYIASLSEELDKKHSGARGKETA
jgi:hypothetical protein